MHVEEMAFNEWTMDEGLYLRVMESNSQEAPVEKLKFFTIDQQDPMKML